MLIGVASNCSLYTALLVISNVVCSGGCGNAPHKSVLSVFGTHQSI